MKFKSLFLTVLMFFSFLTVIPVKADTLTGADLDNRAMQALKGYNKITFHYGKCTGTGKENYIVTYTFNLATGEYKAEFDNYDYTFEATRNVKSKDISYKLTSQEDGVKVNPKKFPKYVKFLKKNYRSVADIYKAFAKTFPREEYTPTSSHDANTDTYILKNKRGQTVSSIVLNSDGVPVENYTYDKAPKYTGIYYIEVSK